MPRAAAFAANDQLKEASYMKRAADVDLLNMDEAEDDSF